MKAIVSRRELMDAVAIAGKATVNRTTFDALRCVRLVGSGRELHVEATNLETFVRATVTQVEIDSPEPCAVRADELLKALRSMTEDTLSIDNISGKVVVQGDRSKMSYFAGDHEKMPVMQPMKDGTSFDVPGSELAAAVAVVSKIPAVADSRYTFNGVFFNATGAMLNVVASDGRRMAEYTIPIVKATVSGIVPVVPLSIIAAAAAGSEDSVAITMDGRAARFSIPSLTVCTVLMEGSFPPYDGVIPTDCDKTVACDRGALLAAIRQAMLVTTEDSKGARFEWSKSGLKICSSGPGIGDAEVSFPCPFKGEPLTIGLNPQMIAEALAGFSSDTVSIGMTTPNRPALFEAPSVRFVQMPINMAE